MCGVAGVFSKKSLVACEAEVERGLQSMRYRGPDHLGMHRAVVDGNNLVLGHNRLSIIDLSQGGNQPMVSRSGDISLTFNGEIYNYIELRSELVGMGWAFASNSDTEVLLAAWEAWGVACLERLDGMFAFVVFDKPKNTLYCAVDPFGIKPFYYESLGESFRFCSELPALMRMSSQRYEIDCDAAYKYLVWGLHDVGAQTFLKNVKRLPPGHLLRLDLQNSNRPSLIRWWNPSIDEKENLRFEDASDKLRALFLGSVKRQLRSDVPVGFALSGGVDSSSIVCAARYLEPDMQINTFSYLSSNEDLNEKKWASLINDHVGARHHWITDSDETFALESALAAQGEPFGSTSILASYYVFEAMRSNEIVVSLDGQGADEALAGYDGYPGAVVRDFLDLSRPFSALKFLYNWSQWPGRGGGSAAKVLGDVLVPDMLRKFALSLLGYSSSPKWINEKVFSDSGAMIGPPAVSRGEMRRTGRRLAERLEHALTNEGLPRLLRYADRNSMHYSIESRVPFLSPKLVEFCLSMPMDYMVSHTGQTKNLFRAAMRGIVPDEVLFRRDKIGFATPELELLRRNRQVVEGWVEVADDIPFLNPSESKKVVKQYLDGDITYKARCWRLVNMCRWYADVRGGLL